MFAAKNGVVLATEKKLPSILVDEDSVERIQLLTGNIGECYEGCGSWSPHLLLPAETYIHCSILWSAFATSV